MLALEELLQTKSEKDLPDFALGQGEIDLLGGYRITPHGLLQLPWCHLRRARIEKQPGDGSFHRHDTKGGGCCRVGGGTG